MDETKKHRQDPVPMKMGRNKKKIRFPEQIKTRAGAVRCGKDILTMKSLILAQDER